MEGRRGGGGTGPVSPTVSVTTYWYHIILFIDDFNIHLHIFVCSFCSFVEHPRVDGQIYIVANII